MTEPTAKPPRLKDRLVRFAHSLRGRLLVLTLFFVMLAEVFVYVPSIANHRERLLMERLEMAQIAALAREATMDREVEAELEAELLRNAGVLTVTLQRDDRRSLMLSVPEPPMVDYRVTLGDDGFVTLIAEAFGTLVAPPGRVLYVMGAPVNAGGNVIEFTLIEDSLKRDLLLYSRNILLLSLFISGLAAVLVYISLDRLLLRPMSRITDSMSRFRERPEDASRIIAPRAPPSSELGRAEAALSEMQRQVHGALQQKTRLAALGLAVSKINHDLRNLLATSQLMSDRLLESEDPAVQRQAGKLVQSIGRAVDLCTRTLKFGKAEEAPPEPRPVPLAGMADEVAVSLDLAGERAVAFENRVPADLYLLVDPDQIFRVLLNIMRNAAEALRVAASAAPKITVNARGQGEFFVIEIADNGPGLPEKAREHLFEPFQGSARGGTGLGLAIAAELVAAHGGELTLASTGPKGTIFRLKLPAASTNQTDFRARAAIPAGRPSAG